MSHIFAAPNIPPILIKVTKESPTTIAVSWSPLTLVEARGFVQSYTVLYFPIISSKHQQCVVNKRTVMVNQSTTVIDGMDVNTVYGIQIYATTKGGDGVHGIPVLVYMTG